MRAARIHAFGGPEAIQLDPGVPEPEPAYGEVVVQIKGAGVNFFDTELRSGIPIPKLPLPHTLGLDGAGIITAVGPGVDAERVDQQVVIYPNVTCGECSPCITGYENRCERFSLVGVTRPGTYADHIAIMMRFLSTTPRVANFSVWSARTSRNDGGETATGCCWRCPRGPHNPFFARVLFSFRLRFRPRPHV